MRSLVIAFLGLALIPFISTQCPVCGGGYPDLEQQVEAVRVETVAWLASQQEVPGSWVSLNTQNAIFGLQLGDPSWFANLTEEFIELTTSRLEYELMTYLLPWRASGSFDLPAGQLAQYMLALQSVQIPAEDFYGINLHRLMARFLRPSRSDERFDNFFQYSLGILSQCSNNVTIRRGVLKKLAFSGDKGNPCVTRFDRDSGHNLDILSLEVMAMVCASDQARKKNIRSWDTYLDAKVQCIIDGQGPDGTFGNAITTSLAVQALTAAAAAVGEWDCVTAIQWLLGQQDEGDFGGVASTAQIIPFLNCNNFGSLRTVEIETPVEDIPTDETGRPIPPTIQPNDATVTFDIEVRIDDEVDSYSSTIIEGENLYYGMIRLAAVNSGFTFESSDSAFGQSIDAINGVYDDPDASLYWTIRIGDPDTFAEAGIEGLTPEGEELYIFILTDFS